MSKSVQEARVQHAAKEGFYDGRDGKNANHHRIIPTLTTRATAKQTADAVEEIDAYQNGYWQGKSAPSGASNPYGVKDE